MIPSALWCNNKELWWGNPTGRYGYTPCCGAIMNDHVARDPTWWCGHTPHCGVMINGWWWCNPIRMVCSPSTLWCDHKGLWWGNPIGMVWLYPALWRDDKWPCCVPFLCRGLAMNVHAVYNPTLWHRHIPRCGVMINGHAARNSML